MFRLLVVVIAGALMCGCGLKGPLYHPGEKPQSKSSVKPPATSPATQGQMP